MMSLEVFANNDPIKQRDFLRDILHDVSKNTILVNIKKVVMSDMEMDSEFLTVLYEVITKIVQNKANYDQDIAMQTLKQIQNTRDTESEEADAELDEILAKMK